MKLSLAMIVKNEARCLARCLASVRRTRRSDHHHRHRFNTDDTVKIARESGAIVSHFDWIGDFAAARNHALAQTTGDWILVLDADETVSEPLAREIRTFITGPLQIGRLKIVSDFRHHGQTQRSSTFVSRLFPRGATFAGRIHEQIVSGLPRVNLRGEVLHDGYLETQKSDRNVTMLRSEIARDPANAYLHFQLALEYTSLGRARPAFDTLQIAVAHMQPTDPFAPNVIVDLLYAAMELKEFAAGLRKSSAPPKPGSPTSRIFTPRLRPLLHARYVGGDPAKNIGDLPNIEKSFRRSLALGETEKYKSVHGSGTFLASYNLGVFYHAFGDNAGAERCLQAAARENYAPAAALLQKLHP